MMISTEQRFLTWAPTQMLQGYINLLPFFKAGIEPWDGMMVFYPMTDPHWKEIAGSGNWVVFLVGGEECMIAVLNDVSKYRQTDFLGTKIMVVSWEEIFIPLIPRQCVDPMVHLCVGKPLSFSLCKHNSGQVFAQLNLRRDFF